MMTAFFSSMPMMVCAMMALLLILEQRRRNDRLLPWLIAWAIAATLLYAGHYVYFHHVYSLMTISDTVYVTTNLLVYPLYLIYISELTDRKALSANDVLLTLLLAPGIVAGVVCGMMYSQMDQEEVRTFIDGYLYQNQADGLGGLATIQVWLHRICRVVFDLQVIGVAIAGIMKVRHYNHVVSTLYADTEDKEARGLTTILVLLLVTVALSFALNNIGRSWFNSPLRLAIPATAFSAILFAIGWLGMKQRFSARDILRQHGAKHATPTTPINVALICGRLESLINDEKVFLEQDLRLEDVSKRIGTNRTYLLQALNDGMHMTFKEYINRKRIAYAEKLMESNPTLPKTEIASLSGYNSMSAFYRNYKTYHQEVKSEE